MEGAKGNLVKLLKHMVANKASDLHLNVGLPPMLRVNGELFGVASESALDEKTTEALILAMLSEAQKETYLKDREIDFSYSIDTEERFRINAYWQKGTPAAALRLISSEIPTLPELNLPDSLLDFTKIRQGFVLVTGPTGHGKSTTVASLLNEINLNQNCHIVTIEDPIEYVFGKGKATLSQRELGSDTMSFGRALKSTLRQDPNVVFVGEMRDLETIQSALTIAETGHLVFSTLHTNSASQTIDRIVDVFPDEKQDQIRTQLASVITAVVSQRLLPAVDGGRVPALEILTATGAVKNVIREGKTHMIDNMIQTSAEVGMISLEKYLAQMVRKGVVSDDVALNYSIRPSELQRQLRYEAKVLGDKK
jgi:twitching motility protein PilT